jgi:hypothetical protein
MSEQPEIEFGDIQDTLGNLGSTPEYQSFIMAMHKIITETPEIPIAHLLAIAVMDMFGPSFVLIGSPETGSTPESEGMHLPSSMGIAINPGTNLTPQDLIYCLRMIANSMENDLPDSDANMEREFQND